MSYWFLVGIAFPADLTIRIFFHPGCWSPDLFLLAIIHLALTRPLGEAYLIAFLGGLVWDGAYLDIPGLHSFLYVLVAMMAARLRLVIWSQYAVSRFVLGFLLTGITRFGEVIFWLSNLNHEIPISVPKQYIFAGACVTGLCYLLIPRNPRVFRSAVEYTQTLPVGRW